MHEQFHLSSGIDSPYAHEISKESFEIHDLPSAFQVSGKSFMPEGIGPEWYEQHGPKPDYQKIGGALTQKILEIIASGQSLAPPAIPPIEVPNMDLVPAPARPPQEAPVSAPDAGPVEVPLSPPTAQLSMTRRLLKAMGFSRRAKTATVVEQEPAATLIERNGYARVAPRFSELVEDTERKNSFSYMAYGNSKAGSATEHEGLVELRDYLRDEESVLSKAMLEDLTFIGEKEYAEGVAGLASYWKHRLDSDPEVQLCVLPGVSMAYGKMKSDKYFLDRILSHFSDDEMHAYKGRLILDPKLLSAPADKAHVILVDDWVISGSQMRKAYNHLLHSIPLDYRTSIEVNLLVASKRRVSGGYTDLDLSGFGAPTLPIRAYYLSHKATGPLEYDTNDAYISGTHSTVDFDFQEPLMRMSGYGSRSSLPRIARVKRSYGGCLNLTRLESLYLS